MSIYLDQPGLLCALGSGPAEVSENLFAGKAPGYTSTECYSPGRVLPLGLINAALPSLGGMPQRLQSRNNALVAAAFAQIEARFRARCEGVDPRRIAVVLGTSTSGIHEGERALAGRDALGSWPGEYDYAQQELGSPAEFLARLAGARGPAYAISTACTSSAKALAAAARLLRHDMADVVLAGGADSLCRFTVAGFSALESISPLRCNPFSLNRRGINIGEAAALFIVSREPGAVELAGWGESSDAHHISAPDPTGRGAREAVEQALSRAGISAGELDYINFHGTATRQNDAMEARVFAGLCPEVPGSSTKALTGHTLGAAGALEAALCWLTLQGEGRLPPQLWDGEPDPELPALHLVHGGQRAEREVRQVLSTSFAFGGNNAALVLRRADSHD